MARHDRNPLGVAEPPRGLWDANFGWQPTPCIEQDNALELVGAVETKLRRIKAMMPLLGVQDCAMRHEFSIASGNFKRRFLCT